MSMRWRILYVIIEKFCFLLFLLKITKISIYLNIMEKIQIKIKN